MQRDNNNGGLKPGVVRAFHGRNVPSKTPEELPEVISSLRFLNLQKKNISADSDLGRFGEHPELQLPGLDDFLSVMRSRRSSSMRLTDSWNSSLPSGRMPSSKTSQGPNPGSGTL